MVNVYMYIYGEYIHVVNLFVYIYIYIYMLILLCGTYIRYCVHIYRTYGPEAVSYKNQWIWQFTDQGTCYTRYKSNPIYQIDWINGKNWNPTIIGNSGFVYFSQEFALCLVQAQQASTASEAPHSTAQHIKHRAGWRAGSRAMMRSCGRAWRRTL